VCGGPSWGGRPGSAACHREQGNPAKNQKGPPSKKVVFKKAPGWPELGVDGGDKAKRPRWEERLNLCGEVKSEGGEGHKKKSFTGEDPERRHKDSDTKKLGKQKRAILVQRVNRDSCVITRLYVGKSVLRGLSKRTRNAPNG